METGLMAMRSMEDDRFVDGTHSDSDIVGDKFTEWLVFKLLLLYQPSLHVITRENQCTKLMKIIITWMLDFKIVNIITGRNTIIEQDGRKGLFS